MTKQNYDVVGPHRYETRPEKVWLAGKVAQASAEEKFLSSTEEDVTWWHLGHLEGKTLKATY